MAEGVFYSDAEYDTDCNSVSNPSECRKSIIDFNNDIQATFSDVVNFSGGLEYQINEQFTPRAGYAYYASPTDGFDRSRQYVSVGISAQVSQIISIDLGVQYGFWDDQNTLYEYELPSGEVGDRKRTRL